MGLDTGFYDECDFVSPPDETPELRLDLRDVKPEHCKGFDAVIHLAASRTTRSAISTGT